MPRLGVRHHQRHQGLRGVIAPPGRRPLHVHPVAPEDQQVKVHLARPPPLALLPAERPLQPLERDEQRGGAGGRIRPGRARPARRPRCGTPAGRGRPPAPWRRGVTRPRGARRAVPRAPGRRRPASRPDHPRWPRARCTPAPAPRHATFRSLDSGAMPPVTVLILAPLLAADAGPLERRLDEARTALAEHHRTHVSRGRRGRGRGPPRAARRYPIRRPPPAAGRGAAAGGPGRARGGIGAHWRHAADLRAFVAGRRCRWTGRSRQPPLLGRHHRDRRRCRRPPRPAVRPGVRQRAPALAG